MRLRGGERSPVEAPVPARVLAVLYDNYTHLVASGPSGVGPDRRPRRQARVDRRGRQRHRAHCHPDAAGGRPRRRPRLHAVSLGVSQSVDALKDGKIDAFFWSGGVPTASVLDLASTAGTAWRLVPNDDVLEALQQTYGAALYSRLIVPRDAYAGLPADVAVVGVANLLVVHQDMPEQLAYDITRLLFEHQAGTGGRARRGRAPETRQATTASPAPFHPGAIRFYRERGEAWAK